MDPKRKRFVFRGSVVREMKKVRGRSVRFASIISNFEKKTVYGRELGSLKNKKDSFLPVKNGRVRGFHLGNEYGHRTKQGGSYLRYALNRHFYVMWSYTVSCMLFIGLFFISL